MAGTKVRKLTRGEIRQFIKLVGRVTPIPEMEPDLIRALWKARLFPMVVAEIVALNFEPKTIEGLEKASSLLIERDDSDFPRCTHDAGGYVAPDESFEDAVQRIAQKEIGAPVHIIGVAGGLYNRGLNRDPEFAHVVVCWVSPEKVRNKKAHFFPVNDLPKHILPHHIVIHDVALAWLQLLFKLPEELRNQFRKSSMITDCTLKI